MVQVKGYLNENAIDINDFVLKPEQIAEIILLIDDGKISNSVATQKVFGELINQPEKTALQIAEALNLLQESNGDELQQWIDAAIAKFPEKVTEYKGGKVSLVGLFMGEVMKLSKGKADPKVASQMVKDTLDKA
jgi:aspartyl-tRNA(Asn)/glutamyl-tRNA(Gln) amidotransferase subunit B